MIYIIWWFYAVLVIICRVLKNYSNKPFCDWSWQRKLYFFCWSAVALISFIYGFRAFINNHVFNSFATFLFGIQWILFAFVPCGIKILNKSWLVRRLRDSAFVVLGGAYIYQAFHL